MVTMARAVVGRGRRGGGGGGEGGGRGRGDIGQANGQQGGW